LHLIAINCMIYNIIILIITIFAIMIRIQPFSMFPLA
jgi:hypothetical protein